MFIFYHKHAIIGSMSMTVRQKHGWGHYLSLVIVFLLIGGGIYILLTTLTPMLSGITIDPDNNSTTQLVTQTKDDVPESPRLYIPKIDVNVSYASGDANVMEHGAWWRMPQNGNPKDGGNFVLSAHRFIMGLTPEQTLRKSPFYHIDKLVLGDELVVDYEGERYTYVIDEIFAVKPDAVEIERRTDEPQLTLYSCTLGGAADGREVFVAKLKTDDKEA